MPFGFWFLGITLPSFGGTLATRLLISGHLFAFCFIWSVPPGWWSSGSIWFVGLVWVDRHLVQTARVIWELLTLIPHSTWEPLGKKKIFFLTGQSIAMTQWQEKWPKNTRSLLTQDRKMYWSSLTSSTSSCNQQPGSDQTMTPTSPEEQSLLGPICPCYQGQVEHYLV